MFIALLTVGLLLAMVIPALGISRARKEIEAEKGSYSDILKIKIEHPGNSDYLYISLNTAVNTTPDKYLSDTSSPDEEYPAVCHDLIKIPGVSRTGVCGLDKHKISLQKGEAFTFEDDIIPQAIEIIKKHYGLYKEVEMLPVEDNRENAKLHAEAELNHIRQTGRSSYDYDY